jgi:hypothetical protein
VNLINGSKEIFAGIVGGTRPTVGAPTVNLLDEELILVHRSTERQWLRWQVVCCV